MKTNTITVGTTATLIVSGKTAGGNAAEAHLQNLSGTDIYIGGPDVTTSNGVKMITSDSIWGPVKLPSGSDIWAIVSAGTASLRYMINDHWGA